MHFAVAKCACATNIIERLNTLYILEPFNHSKWNCQLFFGSISRPQHELRFLVKMRDAHIFSSLLFHLFILKVFLCKKKDNRKMECRMHGRLCRLQIQPALDQISDRDFDKQHFSCIIFPIDCFQIITMRCTWNNCNWCLWIQCA